MKKGASKKLLRKKKLVRKKQIARKKVVRAPKAHTVAPRVAAMDGEGARPFVKWAGGKRQLLTDLMRLAPTKYGTYHEPFVGGGALFFGLKPARARLTDCNARLVRTWQGIEQDVEGVLRELREHQKRHCEEYYYSVREQDVDSMGLAQAAAWFIYLNKTGFNGLYRVNSRNIFNVPFGRYAKPLICDEKNLRACSAALREAQASVEVAPFESVLEHAAPGDFVYFDPPYVPVSKTANFTSYTRDGFTLEDQLRLRDVARLLKERGVQVLLSNADTLKVREIYARGFELCTVQAIRVVNSRADRRGPVSEVIIR